jgi:hypothetical protein
MAAGRPAPPALVCQREHSQPEGSLPGDMTACSRPPARPPRCGVADLAGSAHPSVVSLPSVL